MLDDDKVTTGEIYRRLCDMDERQEKRLERIEEQVRITNGRTTTLEAIVKDHGRDLGRLTSAVFPRPIVPTATAAEPGESFTLKMTPKIWTALAAGGGVLFAMVIEKIRQWMAAP